MFTDPVKNLRAFDLRENMIVADLGAGSGFYTIPLAKMVPKGKVYAIEVQRDFLTTIKNKAVEAHLNNVEYLLGDVEKIGGTRIKDGILDGVLASNILFQVEDKSNFIKEIKRILKPGGEVFLIDWSTDSNGLIGLDKIVPEDKARDLFKEEGFVFVRDINAGEHHYGIIFSKN